MKKSASDNKVIYFLHSGHQVHKLSTACHLIGIMVCVLAAICGSNFLLMWPMDERLAHAKQLALNLYVCLLAGLYVCLLAYNEDHQMKHWWNVQQNATVAGRTCFCHSCQHIPLSHFHQMAPHLGMEATVPTIQVFITSPHIATSSHRKLTLH